MKRLTATGLTFVLLLLFSTSNAEEWRWEEDPTFLNPNLDASVTALPGFCSVGGLSDLNGDSKPEYVLIYVDGGDYAMHLAVMEGDFPNISWSIREDFFPAIEVQRDIEIHSITFFDLNNDDAVEIIMNSSVILTNQGSFENPDWVRADDLFPNVQHEDGTPHFCDWDGDGLGDLIFLYDNGYFRWELNDQGTWEGFGFTEIADSVWGRSMHLADLDGDGDADIIGEFDMPCMWTATLAILNEGTPEEPDWSEGIRLDRWGLVNPCVYDLNADGFPDLVQGMKYMLHTGEQGVAEWERPVAWGRSNGGYCIADFISDESVEIISGQGFGGYSNHEFRMLQLEHKPAGWTDANFFEDEFGWLGSGPTDIWAVQPVDYFGDGSRQFAMATTMMDTEKLLLYRDVDTTEGWDWQPVDNFFTGILDSGTYEFHPAFGDIDGDDDLDFVINYVDYVDGRYVSSVKFYEYQPENDGNHWIYRAYWGDGLNTHSINNIKSGDFNGDGRCDLLTLEHEQDTWLIRIYCNVSRNSNPYWISDLEALPNGLRYWNGWLTVADINDDGKSDIITNTAYLSFSTSGVGNEAVVPTFNQLSIHPNPANATVSIEYSLVTNEPGLIKVFDAIGREVYQRALPASNVNSSFDLSLEGWSSGSYRVELASGDQRQTAGLNVLK